jgi:hypothetical protein
MLNFKCYRDICQKGYKLFFDDKKYHIYYLPDRVGIARSGYNSFAITNKGLEYYNYFNIGSYTIWATERNEI